MIDLLEINKYNLICYTHTIDLSVDFIGEIVQIILRLDSTDFMFYKKKIERIKSDSDFIKFKRNDSRTNTYIDNDSGD